jgi:hypothetical protein
VAIVLAAAATLLVAPAVLATTPPSLTGEFFGAGSTSGDGGTFATTATCSQTSPSTITFTASGTVPAGDPYPGSFTESGVVTISATLSGNNVDGNPLYVVTGVDEFFTITSSVGDVSGFKHLNEAGVQGLCDTYVNQPFGSTGSTVTGYFREVIPASDGFGESYDAIIATSGGTFEDSGTSGLLFDDLNVTVSAGNSVTNSNALNDAFRSSGITAVSGVGHATGGGQINPGGSPIAFGFEAKSESGLKGQCDVVDQAAAVKVHCTDVIAWSQVSATEVRVFGDATVNGTATSYEIDAQDNAESGIGADTFSISTGTGYSASGTLSAGNVQIHTS